MREIENREDLSEIVTTFYSRIKTDELLGPIFTMAIPEDEWDDHMVKITNFWDSALFNAMNFRGNPAMTHIKLDKNNHYGITQDHFAIWLNTWINVLDESWTGSKVEEMKMRARKMATGLYIGIWRSKPEEKRPQV